MWCWLWFVAVMIVQISTWAAFWYGHSFSHPRRAHEYVFFFFFIWEEGSCVCLIIRNFPSQNKQLSMTPDAGQTIFFVLECGRMFFLSNPEGVYLFILSDQKTFGCWILIRPSSYIYKGGKRWHLVRGPGGGSWRWDRFLLSYYLSYRNTTNRWGRAVEVRKKGLRSYICRGYCIRIVSNLEWVKCHLAFGTLSMGTQVDNHIG